MKKEELIPYLNKFITVTLDDGVTDSGYVSNPKDFKDERTEGLHLQLLNGLFQTEIPLERIIKVEQSVREDTTKIPILGFDEEPVRPQSIDEQIDELYERSLVDDLDIPLDDLLEPHKQ